MTKTDLAKYENAWRCIPHIVSLGAQKNFRHFAEYIEALWNKSESDFNEEYFRNTVAKAIIWRLTERLVTRQPWYQNGYRANIVAYSIARMSQLANEIENGKTLDLRHIWSQQTISQALEMQLSIITEAVFKTIVDPTREVENVTEWCKKELCWKRVENLKIQLIPKLKMELVEKDELKRSAREAKTIQKIDGGIESQSVVVSLGQPYWQKLLIWSKDRNFLSPGELSVIRVAANMPRMVPSEKQSKWLLNIRVRSEEEGFQI
jgi:hypothetical protein